MGRPSLRPSPRPRLTPTSYTDVVSDMPDSDTATSDTDMVIDTCMARGLLMLSLRLRLILTTLVDTDTPDSDTATSDTDTADTSTESRLNQDLSVNQQLE